MLKIRTLLASEPEYTSILMGKLSSHTQNHILDAYEVDKLYFENLVAYFRKQEEPNRFKGLVSLRSLSGLRTESTGTILANQKTIRKVTSNVYRREKNQRICATCNKWGHFATTCPVGKLYAKCGKKGHLSRFFLANFI